MPAHDDYFLLTRQEVFERFNIPVRALENADAKGFGPRRVLIGRSVRYRVRDILDWIDLCATEDVGEG